MRGRQVIDEVPDQVDFAGHGVERPGMFVLDPDSQCLHAMHHRGLRKKTGPFRHQGKEDGYAIGALHPRPADRGSAQDG